jgi:replicative DNA helicase
MTPEIIITRYLLYNKYFTTYYVYIYKYIKDNKELKNVLKAIESIFNTKNNKEEDISLDELDLYLSVEYKNEYESIYHSIVDSLRSITNLSEDVLLDLLNKIKDRQIATELAILSLEVSEGLKVVEDIFNKCDEFTVKDIVNHEELFVSDDLEVLKNETVQLPGLRWRLPSLNHMLGSLRRGDFGFLFARPETGKTTFLASEVTYFAEQTTRPILWFNNEEQGNKVMLRCYQAALGQTLEEVLGKHRKQNYSGRGKNYER